MAIQTLPKLIAEGIRIISPIENYRRNKEGYAGSFEDIAQSIVKQRWNGEFFEVARTARISQFWIRDFSWCVKGLIQMGYFEQVKQTLNWALQNYKQADKVTTTIFSNGLAFDVFEMAADSLPALIYCINEVDPSLLNNYSAFLNQQISIYLSKLYDSTNLCLRSDLVIPTMKDMITRKSTCVSNTHLLFLVKQIEQSPQLTNPFASIEELQQKFVQVFWQEDHFINDGSDDDVLIEASDPNIWPFWTGIINDASKLKKATNWILENNFEKESLLAFHKQRYKDYENVWAKLTLPNYQGDSLWTISGVLFIEQLYQFDKVRANQLLLKHIKLIESWQDYPELLGPDLGQFKGRFGFGAANGLIWISKVFELISKF